MSIEFNKLSCKFAHKNTRTERHGDEEIRAHDLKFVANCSNKILDAIDPVIRGMIYCKVTDHEGRTQADLEDDSHTPDLRCSMLMGDKKPYLIDYKGAGYRVTLHNQLEIESEDVILTDCKLVGLSFKALPGDTIELTFTVQLYPDDQSYSGDIEELLGDTLDVSLHAPEPEEAF